MLSAHVVDIDKSEPPCEDGFTLVELLVVLVIIAILMAVAVMSFTGAKKTSYHRNAIAAAESYRDAVDAYMADNGNVAPALGSAAWSAASAGPVDALVQNKPYIRTTPEAISDGNVSIGAPGGRAAPGTRAFIAYTSSGSTYSFRVSAVAVGTSTPLATGPACVITNAAMPAGGAKAC
ncbi:MAG: prepilin-type N-terminal cleavage/methylation domain-containing protein [Thermoleophilia bacterium]|nr:prepilin-type N-terminal cleavage/methylation domain-containing protein [Thermoleophilia bacterium]